MLLSMLRVLMLYNLIWLLTSELWKSNMLLHVCWIMPAKNAVLYIQRWPLYLQFFPSQSQSHKAEMEICWVRGQWTLAYKSTLGTLLSHQPVESHSLPYCLCTLKLIILFILCYKLSLCWVYQFWLDTDSQYCDKVNIWSNRIPV